MTDAVIDRESGFTRLVHSTAQWASNALMKWAAIFLLVICLSLWPAFAVILGLIYIFSREIDAPVMGTVWCCAGLLAVIQLMAAWWLFDQYGLVVWPVLAALLLFYTAVGIVVGLFFWLFISTICEGL